MTMLGSSIRPLRVAIIGSGPSGFYAAEALFKSGVPVQVDMFERLPTPYGLVRGGVAPDHQKIKSVIKVYERIALNPSFAFFGNVTVGRDISVHELREFYDAILFACGAETDRRLGIPGEDLPGSHTATAFVGWYNGHPDYADHTFDLSTEVAVVVGQGNVAMDVSRILAKTADELRETDIAQHALDALAESKIKKIHLVGRRGPVQAKFTPPEIKEIGSLADCDPILEPSSLELDPASEEELADPGNQHAQKNMEILREFAARGTGTKRRRYYIHFLKGPVELTGTDRVEGVRLERNVLTGEPFRLHAVGTGQFELLSCGLFFRSVGYRGVPIHDVPFDDRNGVFPNENGRITSDGSVLHGLYAAGWIKRGPSGVIGTNKPCSNATAEVLLSDIPELLPAKQPDSEALRRLLAGRGLRVVSFADWQAIDQAEIARGLVLGKPREKFTSAADMLALLG